MLEILPQGRHLIPQTTAAIPKIALELDQLSRTTPLSGDQVQVDVTEISYPDDTCHIQSMLSHETGISIQGISNSINTRAQLAEGLLDCMSFSIGSDCMAMPINNMELLYKAHSKARRGSPI